MPIQINGTSGISGVDGSAGTPALQGTDTNTGIAFGSDVIIGSTGGVERWRTTPSGQWLVGTSSTSANTTALFQGYGGVPTGGAHLRLAAGTNSPANGSNLGLVLFSDSEHTNCAFVSADRDGGTWSASSKPTRLVFSTCPDNSASPVERLRIGNNGRIAINSSDTTSAGEILQIRTNLIASAEYGLLVSGNSSTYTNYALRTYNTATSAVVGSITFSTSATAFNTSSDYRLKENVKPVDDGIARLQQLKPSRFNFIAEPDKTVDGFIAHEVQNVVPEAITGEKDAVDDDGNPIYQGIDQSKLVPLLTAALQEAVAKIESLEARLTAAGI